MSLPDYAALSVVVDAVRGVSKLATGSPSLNYSYNCVLCMFRRLTSAPGLDYSWAAVKRHYQDITGSSFTGPWLPWSHCLRFPLPGPVELV